MALKDKVAGISGASGGIGQTIARQFVEEGARVLTVDIDEGAALELVSDYGDAVSGLGVDVTSITRLRV